MPLGPDLLLHLDSPRITPPYAEFEMVGWVVARSKIKAVRLAREDSSIPLALVPRPDVVSAFPDHEFASGFLGTVAASAIQHGNFIFRIDLEDGTAEFHHPVAAPLFAPRHTPPPAYPLNSEFKVQKIARISERLLCPHCRSVLPATTPTCRRCGAAFEFIPTRLDFLSPEQRVSASPGDAPVSSGGMDELMHAFIARFSEGLILDCGAGSKATLYPNVINLEIADYPSTDVRAFNESLPFQDATFDAVFTLATLEHVRDPFLCAREILRVLKPGGIIYSMIPLLQPFHGYPNHYYNMTIEGHKNLFGSAVEILDESVPICGRPIWAMAGILEKWVAGLPPAHVEEFLDLRVRDLIANPLTQLDRNYVRFLSPWANGELAAATRVIAKKRT